MFPDVLRWSKMFLMEQCYLHLRWYFFFFSEKKFKMIFSPSLKLICPTLTFVPLYIHQPPPAMPPAGRPACSNQKSFKHSHKHNLSRVVFVSGTKTFEEISNTLLNNSYFIFSFHVACKNNFVFFRLYSIFTGPVYGSRCHRAFRNFCDSGWLWYQLNTNWWCQ